MRVPLGANQVIMQAMANLPQRYLNGLAQMAHEILPYIVQHSKNCLLFLLSKHILGHTITAPPLLL